MPGRYKQGTGKGFSNRWVLIALVFAGARCLWPGDIPFCFDEPQLLERALDQNAAGAWTVHGLTGSRGVDYGPLPIYFYRLLLLFTHDLVVVAFVKAAIVSFATLGALAILFRQCPWIPRPLLALPFLSPYLWLSARDMWDNSLLVPFTAWFFVSVVVLAQAPKFKWWAVFFFSGTAAFLTHLLAVPLLLAGTFVVLLAQVKAKTLFRQLPSVGALAAACFAVSFPYLQHLLASAHGPAPAPRVASFFHGFFGARLFSGLALEYFLGPMWFLRGPAMIQALLVLCIAMSAVAFALVFHGIYIAGQKLRRTSSPSERVVAQLALTAWVFNIVLLWMNGLVSHPQYYLATTWVVFAFLCFGANHWAARPGSRHLLWGYQRALGITLLFMAVLLHSQHGNRQPRYGPTLGNQIEVARRMNHYGSEVPVQDARPAGHLISLRVLRRFLPVPPQLKQASGLEVVYLFPERAEDGRVDMVVLKSP